MVSQAPEVRVSPLEEPLGALARFAFDWAEVLCKEDHGCAGYHKMWTLVRCVEAGGALPAGADFFNRELPRLARDGHARVVLSGAADTGLMTLAHNALSAAGIKGHLILVDRCATPLAQCRLFAAQSDIALETHEGTVDALQVAPVDAILAHSFLNFIPTEGRKDLFAAWSGALRQGGCVLLSNRISPDNEPYKRVRSPEQIRARRAKLHDALQKANPVVAQIDAILDAAEQLWTNPMGGNPVSEDEVRKLAMQSGFDVSFDYKYDGEDSVSPFAMLSQTTRRPRAEIILTRR